MTRVQQMLLHRRKLKNLGNLRSVVLGTPMHFRFTPSEVSLKYEPNLEARLNIEGKALSNDENYNGLYVKILRLKNRINCLLRASFVNTFWSRNSACW